MRTLTKDILKECGIANIKFTDSGVAIINRFGNPRKIQQNGGYRGFICTVGKKRTFVSLNRAVYAWFIGEIPSGKYVVPIDGDKNNIQPDNLTLVERGDFIK